jgi:adenosylcobinamide kinase/adenosylcobinamide-phosphate guanylyltransferase
MLAVLTGPVRSGKSKEGLRLALASGVPVVMAVGGMPDDEEMVRRIARHRSERGDGIAVLETAGDPAWRDRVPADACLLVDCLGTVFGAQIASLVPEDADILDPATEHAAEAMADELVVWLARRPAPTVVVTNETGWGVVPATPLGRLFRDVMGRMNRALVGSAAVAWLVVAGRAVPLHEYEQEVTWPKEG